MKIINNSGIYTSMARRYGPRNYYKIIKYYVYIIIFVASLSICGPAAGENGNMSNLNYKITSEICPIIDIYTTLQGPKIITVQWLLHYSDATLIGMVDNEESFNVTKNDSNNGYGFETVRVPIGEHSIHWIIKAIPDRTSWSGNIPDSHINVQMKLENITAEGVLFGDNLWRHQWRVIPFSNEIGEISIIRVTDNYPTVCNVTEHENLRNYNFTSINEAIKYIQEGGEVRVYAERCDGQVIINKPLRLVGIGKSYDEKPIISDDNESNITEGVVIINSSDVTIQGFRITGLLSDRNGPRRAGHSGTQRFAGISTIHKRNGNRYPEPESGHLPEGINNRYQFLDSRSLHENINITNNIIDTCRRGIRLELCDNININFNEIANFEKHGIQLIGCKDMTLISNSITITSSKSSYLNMVYCELPLNIIGEDNRPIGNYHISYYYPSPINEWVDFGFEPIEYFRHWDSASGDTYYFYTDEVPS